MWPGLPPWLSHVVLSAIALGGAYLAGLTVKWTVGRRLTTLAAKTRGPWDDILATAVVRRLPFWSALAGAYVALGVWALPPRVDAVIDKGIFVLAAASLTFCAVAIVAGLTGRYGPALGHAMPITSLTRTIASGVVFTIGVLIVLNGLGVSVTPILTALGVGGLAVALALQDTLSNFFAGIYVTLAGQIRVGDYIRLDAEHEGYVADIGWRSTRIRMLPNNLVLVPNAKLGQAIVTNFYLPDKALAVLVEVGVDYASDLDVVERVTTEVARDTLAGVEGADATFDPFIRYHTFGESSIDFTVILRAREYTDQYLLKHEFIKRLHRRYGSEGISIPFPIRTIVQREVAPEGVGVGGPTRL